MRTLSKALLAVAVLALPGAAVAQEYYEEDAAAVEAQPNAPEPAVLPPPPPSTTAAPVQAAPAGQWTYTSQYGWVWLPYAQSYTYVPADGSHPSVYAYYPSHGWRWIAAPWVYGVGPRPHWGVHGFARFAWHSRPWFKVSSHVHHRAHYRHQPAHHYRYGGHRTPGWTGGHRGSGNRHGGARHDYRPSGGGNRNHWSGGNRGHGGSQGGQGHRGGARQGTHSARPAGRR